MPYKTLFLWLIIQAIYLPVSFSQSPVQLRANLYGFDPDGTAALLDGNLTKYDSTYSNAVDDYDAAKMTNFGENFGLQRGTTILAIERRRTIGSSDSVFFKMWNMRQVTYLLQVVATNLYKPGLTGVLEDQYLNTKTNLFLSDTTRLAFTISSDPASAAPGRFRILFAFPAPVVDPALTFTKVSAIQKNDYVNVEWQVKNEKNVLQYDVEKSTDGINFIKLSTSGANAKDAISKHYSWVDLNPVKGDNYYRIRSISKTGSVKYSSIVMVHIGKKGGGIRVYPNPVAGNGSIAVDVSNMAPGPFMVKLINNFGRMVLIKKINHILGVSIETFRPDIKLLTGIYQLEIYSPDKTVATAKIIVQ